MSFDEALRKVETGKASASALYVITDTLEAQEHAIDVKVFRVISGGTPLDNQYAVQAWLEKHSIHKLRTSLEKKIRAGQKGEIDGP